MDFKEEVTLNYPDGTTYTDILAFTGDYDNAAKGVSKKATIDFIKFLVKKCTS